MREISCYQLDAFTRTPFRGNPAAVCPLEAWLADELMQAIARENAVSETAFFVPSRTRSDDFDLRWMTPTVEVDLCGHATLAAAFVVMTKLDQRRTAVRFHTQSGPLDVTREGGALTLDMPARPPEAGRAPSEADLTKAFGVRPLAVFGARDTLCIFASTEEVRGLQPQMERVAALDTFGVIATAPGTGKHADVDFVSRYFAPRQGVPEDPVTGSSHATLVPYWAARLGKTTLKARQVSARTGELRCELAGNRVRLTGHVVLMKSGSFIVPDVPWAAHASM